MEQKKYIHYCWFGDKPLSKLAKKCIKSWKKFLPDYEIIKWSEKNVDLNECAFIKEAYEKKKWAFVADYVRTKALYQYGGIYFDTDMMLKKNINFLLDKGTFLGFEDSNMVNAAVWGAAKPKTFFAKKMLEYYNSQEHFNDVDIYSNSIPRIIMKILKKYNLDPTLNKVQVINKDIYIYPREYFYPLSYNYRNNVFTENTCMIHYFEATWLSEYEKRENKIFRFMGEKNGTRFINIVRLGKKVIKKTIKIVFFPLVVLRRYKKRISKKYLNHITQTLESIEKVSDNNYVVFHNPEWFGVTSATKELFENRIPCGELLRKKDIIKIGDLIIKKNVKQIIFSAMCLGWKDLAIYLKKKNKKIKVKVFWHGSHSQVSEPYGWQRNMEILKMNKEGIIDVIATCKESLMKFYLQEGYNATFITNKVNLQNKPQKSIKGNNTIRVGLYAAKSDDWRKNMFTQIAAVSLIDNAVIDIVPQCDDAIEFARYLNLPCEGIKKPVLREELMQRMANNDINIYITFSECAPMQPLESFQVGVPCLTGNNHHYFKNSELEKYLVVFNEESPIEIAEKIKYCLNNKQKILKLYEKFERENQNQSKLDIKKFLEM